MRYRARCCYGCKWTQLLDSEEGMLEAERKHYEVCEKSSAFAWRESWRAEYKKVEKLILDSLTSRNS